MTLLSGVALPGHDGEALQRVRCTEDHNNMHNKHHKKDKQYSANTTHYNTQVNKMIRHLEVMFPKESHQKSVNMLREVAQKSYLLADEVYSAQDAEAWGDNFVVSDKLVESDERLFKASMRDLKTMTQRRKKTLEPNRLNQYRIEQHLRKDNPEKEKLLLLAEKGMPLMLRPGFVANGTGHLPALRKTYINVKSAVNRLLVENFHDQGLAFILTKKTALEIPGIHFSPLHWTEKQGKRQGRPIGDCSDGGNEKGNEPLNSTHTKEQSDILWGTIKHPSIDSATRMILDYYERKVKEDPSVKWEDLVLFKKDLRGAFTLLFFDEDGVQNLAMEMTNDKVIIFMCGIFGWTGTPAAFHVVTRALIHELEHKLNGDVTMYSDDILVVTLRKYLESDMKSTETVCTNLLGPNSVETSKDESGKVLTFIGYEIDLENKLITISERNILRTLYGFLNIDVKAPVKVKTLQRLASWASRYSNICVYMKPFVSTLYAEYTGKGDHVSFYLSQRAIRVICCYRVLLGLTAINRIKFSKPMQSFEKRTAEITIEFDASLTGVGLLYYKIENNEEILIGGSAVDISSLNFKSNPAYQNTAEFIAALLGIRGLRQLNVNPKSIRLRGDSITALNWAETSKFKGELVGNAAVVFILQNIYQNVTITEVIHLSAEKNWRCDRLSRGSTLLSLLSEKRSPQDIISVELNKDEILSLCDPNLPTSNEDDFNKFWLNASRILRTGI